MLLFSLLDKVSNFFILPFTTLSSFSQSLSYSTNIFHMIYDYLHGIYPFFVCNSSFSPILLHSFMSLCCEPYERSLLHLILVTSLFTYTYFSYTCLLILRSDFHHFNLILEFLMPLWFHELGLLTLSSNYLFILA